jgi:3-phosphoshikimate 1-carboxyvinyltransferase
LCKRPDKALKGKIFLLGDKSIAHRALFISALSRGQTRIDNFPLNQDCLQTLNALRKLGVSIIQKRSKNKNSFSQTFVVYGRGLWGLKKPEGPIYIKESGTTFRLIAGILAGQPFESRLLADKALARRPMRRVVDPLIKMGARMQERLPSLNIQGGPLKPIIYKMPVASAQVKSAILLAGLYADGITEVIEPVKTRDHTERMLRLFRAKIKVKRDRILLCGRQELVSPRRIIIPADISSASFFIVLASILPGSDISIPNLSLNPGRTGILNVLKRMQAKIHIRAQEVGLRGQEPIGEILVSASKLKGVRVRKDQIPSLIDELPILMVAAVFARGLTVFEGVGELRFKETDRIRSMADNLRKMGAQIDIKKGNNKEIIMIHGGRPLKEAPVSSFGDHRTAMSMIVASLAAGLKPRIHDGLSCIDKSFPGFLDSLNLLLKQA